ncbi:aldo/keto reductase [uncultured Oscillibacter sp.]|jgi:aryl-alcohol dehydrogenase-like predicted oxidoreductase|uniref:aldo/keto reductase n=1 Tax=uncultured Oscillibacter sp. TaxID=876091 RepID=UPI00262C20F0|nr:aldo/keto reductase [uncultured Oscillibacter sp.]
MKTRKIGALTVSEVGMGCMAFSHGYGQIPPETYSIEAIQNAYRHGCTFFDTAEIYSPNLSGTGHNERIVGKALGNVRKDVVLATKLFLDRSEVRRDGSVYDAVRRHLEASMDRLQTDMVDLYYLHRTSGGVSVEEVAEAMGLLIEDGLIRGWGLSQVDVDMIDRAQKVTPLTAIQNIYSMVERDVEAGVIPYCMKHNIGFVPFSPIASGLLSGKITTKTKFERNDDVRNWVPQLSRANIAGNQPIVDLLKQYADRKQSTPAQISLAWMLHKYPNVVPIPGSKNKERIIENLDASLVELTDEDFRSLEESLNKCKVYGHRGFSR